MDFLEEINSLKIELIHQYKDNPSKKPPSNSDHSDLIKKIEQMVYDIMEDIAKGTAPKFEAVSSNFWKNCSFEDRVMFDQTENIARPMKVISFGKSRSRSKFSILMFLLSKIYKLFTNNEASTRRELYYENTDIFKSQKEIDQGMQEISSILNVPTWELRVLATSKGLIAGPVELTLTNNVLDCNKPSGVLVPQNISNIISIKTTAKWILVIEKDAAFQKLIDNDGLSRLGPVIFITGKGYPDVNTRLLLARLWEELRIPILCLVDADPHGIEIMCVYRFGSLAMSKYSEYLACPAMRWLGIHPTDINLLSTATQSFTSVDVKKLQDLICKPFVEQNPELKRQVKFLLEKRKKAEIEGVSAISTAFLTDAYIPNKIRSKEYY